MSLWQTLLASSVTPVLTPPTWYIEKIGPQYIDEGDSCTYELRGINLPTGARVIIWITDAMASNNNWVEPWETVFRREVEAKGGLTIEKLVLKAGTPQGQGYLDVLFTTKADFSPLTRYTFTNTTRRNRADNQTLLLDQKTRGRLFQLLLKQIPPNEGYRPGLDGITKGKGGSYTCVRDTSRSPLGEPTIKVEHRGADGGPFSINVFEGQSFQTVVTGYNVAPNTVIKMYHANVGQNDVKPNIRDQLVSACAAAGCVGTVVQWTQATSLQWFNGGYITFPKGYVSGTPIVLNYTHTRDNVEEPEKQMDVLTNIWREGDVDDLGGIANYAGNWDATVTYKQKDWVFYLPTGRKFVCTAAAGAKGAMPPTDDGDTYENAFWREYVPVIITGTSTSRQLIDIPARYWELRATTDGSTITYTIQGPHASDSTVAFSSTGAPNGFDAAMQQALDASGFMTLTNGRLASTNPTQADGAVTFTVPHTGSGKHVMRLTDVQGTTNSWIVIGDACVYLTPPVIDTVRNLHGWNAAGGEFNSLYTPSYTPEKGAAVWGNVPAGGFMAYNGGRYYYPSKPENMTPAEQHQQMDYFYSRGARYMRLPFKMQRLQRQAFGPLYYGDDGPIGRFTNHDMRRIIELARYWLNLDPKNRIMFDNHQFGSYTYRVDQEPGGTVATAYADRFKFNSPFAPPSILVDFWVRFVETMLVELPMGRWDLDFMNEPIEVNSSVAPAQWAAIMQWLTNAVRARTNYLGICHREGSEYTSASNWVANGNGPANLNSYDPAKNMVFHVHSYNDKDASGVSGTCVANAGKARLMVITEWARANGFTRANGHGLFLGETGAGSPLVAGQEVCGGLIREQLQYILDNSDVWMGYTWYASGFGASYPFSLDPSNGNYLEPVETVNLLMNSEYWKKGNGLPA